MDGKACRKERLELAAVGGITLFAVGLRLVRLGALSFSGDEETTTLAALALLEGWPPELPGGLVYLRALPFTLLESLALHLGGANEFTMRLVPVLSVAPRIVAAWWLARNFVPPPLALVVAVLVAIAPMDVEYSRTARMYSLFSTLDLVFVALVVRLATSGVGVAWTTGVGVLTTLTHSLFAMHLPLPLVACAARVRVWPRLLAVTAIALAVFLLQRDLLAASYGSGVLEFDGWRRAEPLSLHLTHLRQATEVPAAALLVGFGILASIAAIWFALPIIRGGFARALAIAGAVACAVASPVLGGLALLATLILEGQPLASLLSRHRALAAVFLAPTLSWLVAAASAVDSQGIEFPIRVVLGFPAPNWLDFARAAPVLSCLAAFGVFVASDRAADSSKPAAWLVLLAAALSPSLGGGVFVRTEALRYQLHALVPLLLLAVIACEWLGRRVTGRRRHSIAIAIALITIAVRPDQSLRAVMRPHGPISEPFAVLSIAPDHRGAAAFVRRHMDEYDWIAAEDPLQQRLYLGRADYWLRRIEDAAPFLRSDQRGDFRDLYVGSLHVGDLQSLRSRVANGHHRGWVITSGEVETAPDWYRTSETDAELREWRERAWFVGEDGATRVFRLVDGEPVPPPSLL